MDSSVLYIMTVSLKLTNATLKRVVFVRQTAWCQNSVELKMGEGFPVVLHLEKKKKKMFVKFLTLKL